MAYYILFMSRLNTVVAVNSISLRLGTVHLLLSNYVTVKHGSSNKFILQIVWVRLAYYILFMSRLYTAVAVNSIALRLGTVEL